MSETQARPLNRVQSSAHGEELLNNQRLPRPLCWHEGMLLSPQHFQQNHQYWEAQLSRMTMLQSPAFWGVSQLQIDRNELLEGRVVVQRLVAIMPDGMLIDYDSLVDEPLTLPLEFGESNSSLTIQLAVPIQVAGSASGRSEIQRFASLDSVPHVDENTGDNELVMTRLQPRIYLQATNRVGRRYVGLPLFRVVKPDGGSVQLDADYAPPLLTVGADDFRMDKDESGNLRSLQKLCRALALTIRYKARLLAGLSEDEEVLGRSITQRHHRWIRAMVQELALFEIQADDPHSKPGALYASLVRMAGPMSELDSRSLPPRFPAYNHDDMLPGFQQVLRYLGRLVDQVNLNYTTLQFEEVKDGVFSIDFEKAWDGRSLLVELRPRRSSSREACRKWLETCCIASFQLHKELQQRRMLGARAEEIERDEQSGIVPAPGNLLFRIEASKTNRAFIRPGTPLTILSSTRLTHEDRPDAILLHMTHEEQAAAAVEA